MIERIRRAAKKKILFLPHAVQQMSSLDRMIKPCEVRKVVTQGSVIEDYPEDVRGHSCLLLVCSPKDEYLVIITAYIPDQKQWIENFSRRVEK